VSGWDRYKVIINAQRSTYHVMQSRRSVCFRPPYWLCDRSTWPVMSPWPHSLRPDLVLNTLSGSGRPAGASMRGWCMWRGAAKCKKRSRSGAAVLLAICVCHSVAFCGLQGRKGNVLNGHGVATIAVWLKWRRCYHRSLAIDAFQLSLITEAHRLQYIQNFITPLSCCMVQLASWLCDSNEQYI